MKKVLIALALIIFIVGFFWLLPTSAETSSPIANSTNTLNIKALSGDFVITNVRIFDGEKTIEKGVVVVKDNQLVLIGNDDTTTYSDLPILDASGHTLLPGLVDAHTHSWGDAPKEALNFGVATMLDMFTVPDFMQGHLPVRDSQLNTQQADLFSPMYLATAPNGHGTQFGMPVPVLERIDQVPQFVANRVAEGADYIKAVYFSAHSPNQHFPSISLKILKALAEHSQQHGLKLLVHIDDLISAKEAIQVGADGLVHMFTDELADQEIIDLMRANDVFVVPTLSIIARATHVNDGIDISQSVEIQKYLRPNQVLELQRGYPEFGLTPENYQIAQANVKTLHDAGIIILAGSDAPNPGTTHGASLHEELQRFVQAGLTPEQALKAATGMASTVLSISTRGRLSTSSAATMLLVEGDPLVDINATQSIVGIWKHGQSLTRYMANDASASKNPLSAGLNFDFNSGDTDLDKHFMVTTDQMMQGHSEGAVQFQLDTAPGYLEFNGEIKPGFMYPWTGIAVALGGGGQPIDISHTSQLTLSARTTGNPSTLTVLLIQEGIRQPFMFPIQLDSEWQQHQIDLTQMPGVDLTKIVNLSLTFMREPGHYNLQLDSISLKSH
ncbi:amidohydrolase family protein [Alteromonadaceae bacterium BrNp21-10]|nr:amidohydrolase family protein [Alteromonadaceae bacterium BrNp21-10]